MLYTPLLAEAGAAVIDHLNTCYTVRMLYEHVVCSLNRVLRHVFCSSVQCD